MNALDSCPRCKGLLSLTGSCLGCGYPKPPVITVEMKPGGAIKKQYIQALGKEVIVCNLDAECTDC